MPARSTEPLGAGSIRRAGVRSAKGVAPPRPCGQDQNAKSVVTAAPLVITIGPAVCVVPPEAASSP